MKSATDIERLYAQAQARAAADPELATTLGVVMLTGFAFIDSVEKFTGDQFENRYQTFFPMPDGDEWEFVLKRKRS